MNNRRFRQAYLALDFDEYREGYPASAAEVAAFLDFEAMRARMPRNRRGYGSRHVTPAEYERAGR